MALAFVGERKRGAGPSAYVLTRDITSRLTSLRERITQKQMSDTEIAMATLTRELREYSKDVPTEQQKKWVRLYGNMEQLRYMNMKTLAAVLVFLNRYNDFKPEDLQEEYTKRLIESLMSKPSPELMIRYQATFIRYARIIKSFQQA